MQPPAWQRLPPAAQRQRLASGVLARTLPGPVLLLLPGAAPAALLPPPKAKAKATAKAKAEASASAADATWAAGLAVENAAAMAKASAEAAALPPQPKAKAKTSVEAPALAAGPPPALGCAKCRGSPNGCAQCKNPLFKALQKDMKLLKHDAAWVCVDM